VFWGVLLLLWGISLILKGFDIIDLPLVKIFIAVIIIMFGIKLLTGGSCTRSTKSGIRTRIMTSGDLDYTSIFASQEVDLTDIEPDSPPLEITAIFGSSLVHLPDDIEFVIEQTSIFGSVKSPSRPQQAMGKQIGKVRIEANAIFGGVEFDYRPSQRSSSYHGAAPDSTSGVESDSIR
ncbi:MAG: hypothetical protein ACP5F3_08220, partial [Candidatus Syntrophosphaera sp.]